MFKGSCCESETLWLLETTLTVPLIAIFIYPLKYLKLSKFAEIFTIYYMNHDHIITAGGWGVGG